MALHFTSVTHASRGVTSSSSSSASHLLHQRKQHRTKYIKLLQSVSHCFMQKQQCIADCHHGQEATTQEVRRGGSLRHSSHVGKEAPPCSLCEVNSWQPAQAVQQEPDCRQKKGGGSECKVR